MLVDNGAIVNVMSYALYKKLGGTDEELVKTDMMITRVGGAPILARGIANIELTIGSKTLATTFFVVDVQGSYSYYYGLIGSMPTVAYHLAYTSFLFNGWMMPWRLCIQIHRLK
jgi:hypothetical protein